MKKYNVTFRVDGKNGGSIMVEAQNSSQARNLAKAELERSAGYVGKKIYVGSASEVR